MLNLKVKTVTVTPAYWGSRLMKCQTIQEHGTQCRFYPGFWTSISLLGVFSLSQRMTPDLK